MLSDDKHTSLLLPQRDGRGKILITLMPGLGEFKKTSFNYLNINITIGGGLFAEA
jgi:hypothetical protein